MRYLLVVGFSCDVYRKEPIARIFVGNKLIDEFYISFSKDNIGKAITDYFSKIYSPILQPSSVRDFPDLIIMKNHPILRFYEVEIDEKIKHLTLRINIDNSDSNYCNGFMTNSTLIKFKICYFFPFDKRVLFRLKEIRNKNQNSINYAWYKSKKNFLFDLTLNGMYCKEIDEQKFEDNSKILHLSTRSIGTNVNFICQLTKKYGILMPPVARACRYNFDWHITSFFFDKYLQYENQSNSN